MKYKAAIWLAWLAALAGVVCTVFRNSYRVTPAVTFLGRIFRMIEM
jgi:hypothetical protein